MFTSDKIRVAQIAEQLLYRKWRFGTAESCTGGGIAMTCSSLPGSSRWFEGGIVAYSNQIKANLLHVSDKVLEETGAVSEATASAMARGAQLLLNCEVAVSVTGIAGPDGGTPQKPVGMVCFGWAVQDRIWVETKIFKGHRNEVRQQAVSYSLAKLPSFIQG